MKKKDPSLLQMIRAPFLSSIIVPIVTGTLLSAKIAGSFGIMEFLLVLFTGLGLHIATNVYNDIYDTLQGTDKVNVHRNEYSGGSGVLLDNPDLADEKMIQTKLKEFILLMTKSQGAPSQLDFLSALFKPLDIEFKSTIQHNLYANLSLDELARLCHLSTSSFKRKFTETFNASPKKYISQKKIEKAAVLLKKEDSRVSDIAYDVGFDSLATFNRNFTSIYGKSPSEYRLS
jgi:AraC-like DNA-binding protein